MTDTNAAVDLLSLEPLDHRGAIEPGREEYRRFVDVLDGLAAGDWARPTDCEGWTVRDLAGHLAGSMVTVSSLRNTIAEQRQVKKRARETGEAEVDAMTAIQIAKMAHLDGVELVATMRSHVDAAAAGRRRVPRLMARLVRFPVKMWTIDETWQLGYLLGPILTRDTWLHRVSDLARAVERLPLLDAAHDGTIVADVAAEWARRHGEPVELVLTGPAGGHFVAGEGGPRLELDALDFCRMLSGRATPTHPLLETIVPF
jgi:uncharacterized protein (TIGR03083 family)